MLIYALVSTAVPLIVAAMIVLLARAPSGRGGLGLAYPMFVLFWALVISAAHSAVASALAVALRGGWAAWTLLSIHAGTVLAVLHVRFISRPVRRWISERKARRHDELHPHLVRVSHGGRTAVLRQHLSGIWTLEEGTIEDWIFTHIHPGDRLQVSGTALPHPDEAVAAELCALDGPSAMAGLSRLRRMESRRHVAEMILDRDAHSVLRADLFVPTPEGAAPGGNPDHAMEILRRLAAVPDIDATTLIAAKGVLSDRTFRRAIAGASRMTPEGAQAVAAAELADASAGRLHEVLAPLAAKLPVARALDALDRAVQGGAYDPDHQRSEILTALLARRDLGPEDAELILSRMPRFQVVWNWNTEKSPLLALLGKVRIESLLSTLGRCSHWSSGLLQSIARWEGLTAEDADRVAAAVSNLDYGRERAYVLRSLAGKASPGVLQSAVETLKPEDRAIVDS